MSNTTLYVSDLDGTLLNSSIRVSARSAEIINSLIARGMRFTYATARALETAGKVAAGLRLEIPVIVHNGAFIRHPDSGEVMHSCFFSEDEAAYIRALLSERGIRPLVYSIIGGTDRVSWNTAHVSKGMQVYLEARRGDRRMRPSGSDGEVYEGRPFYINCIGDAGEFNETYDIINRDGRFYCTLQEDMYQHDYWFEIMPREATKANAVRRLCAMLGCDRIVSFGDAVNDLPMFEASDECYAVDGAIPELKATATAVIGSNDSDGVAEWLLQNYR